MVTLNYFSAAWWVVAIVLIKSSKSFAAGALYVQWRWNLTSVLHSRYLTNKIYYELNCLNSGIDNPDMRITQVEMGLSVLYQALKFCFNLAENTS